MRSFIDSVAVDECALFGHNVNRYDWWDDSSNFSTTARPYAQCTADAENV